MVMIDANSPLARRLVNVTFDIARSAPTGETRVSFANDPTPSSVSDASANRLATGFEDGTVTISGATASGYTVSGRVATADGNGLRNATVSMTDSNGATRIVTTSSFGFYQFEGVAAGDRYTITVGSRRYRFAGRVVTVDGNLLDIDFVGHE
jgi:hypothetical protein